MAQPWFARTALSLGAVAWLCAAPSAHAALATGTLFTNFVSATYGLPSGVPGGPTDTGFNSINVPNGATAWVMATDNPQLCFGTRKTADVAGAAPGDMVCWTIGYSNCGSVTVQSVTLTDYMPCNTTRSGLPTVAWGQTGVPAGTWATSLAGPWNTTSATGLTCPLYLRWILPAVSPHKTGYIRYCVTVQ